MIVGMAELFKQHCLDFCCSGDLQPGAIEIDAFPSPWCGAGVGAIDAAEGISSEDLEADPQTAAAEAGLQGAGGVRALRPKDLQQHGVVGV